MIAKTLILKSTADKSMSDDIDLLAIGATFDEIDKEGEIIKSGAIAEGKVSIGSWGHSSIPAGVGDIKQVEKQLILEGKFFDTQMGRDTREIVKELSEVLEWSIGGAATKVSHQVINNKSVKVLEEIVVKEVVPTLIGASNGTGTLMAKCNCGNSGAKGEDLNSGAESNFENGGNSASGGNFGAGESAQCGCGLEKAQIIGTTGVEEISQLAKTGYFPAPMMISPYPYPYNQTPSASANTVFPPRNLNSKPKFDKLDKHLLLLKSYKHLLELT